MSELEVLTEISKTLNAIQVNTAFVAAGAFVGSLATAIYVVIAVMKYINE